MLIATLKISALIVSSFKDLHFLNGSLVTIKTSSFPPETPPGDAIIKANLINIIYIHCSLTLITSDKRGIAKRKYAYQRLSELLKHNTVAQLLTPFTSVRDINN